MAAVRSWEGSSFCSMEMDDLEVPGNGGGEGNDEHDDRDDDMICNTILCRFKNSVQEDHQHLCAVVGAISQELRDHKLPLTPLAYFGATLSSLNRLTIIDSYDDPAAIASLLTLLSTILPRISSAVLRNQELVSTSSPNSPIIRILERQQSISIVAAKAALKCSSHLLAAADKSNWLFLAPSYDALLRYITDHRPKVRRQAHMCLRDILQSFRGSAALGSACERIANTLERYLLLAGGSNSAGSNGEDGRKGAMEVLYILNALKVCLPLMSQKTSTKVLTNFKILLELKQPIVTRCIMDILHALCSSPTLEFAPQVLLDLLCSIASTSSAKEKSADGLMFMARLLHIGIEKVYGINREICVVKLPVIFNALGEILACEHEEAICGATEALRGLICTCIDERLIQQGKDQISLNTVEGSRRSGPTVIEKICATVESFLGYQYSAVWDMAFQVLSAMFYKLGESSSYLMRGAIMSLTELQKLPDEDLAYRKQLHECVGSALGAMGPEQLLSLLPLNLDAGDTSKSNVWLLPILKQYTVGARLSFFTTSILALVGLVRQKSQMLEKEGQIFSSRSTEGLVYLLWSLLPAFCNYPLDTADSFKGLAKSLGDALYGEPDLRGLICSSLQILIQQNKKVLAENKGQPNSEGSHEIGIPEQRARDHYTLQFAADNVKALSLFSQNFLSVLFKIFEKSPSDGGGCLQSTIGEFASISDKMVVKRFFKTTMAKLLKVTSEAVEQQKTPNSMRIVGSANESSLALTRMEPATYWLRVETECFTLLDALVVQTLNQMAETKRSMPLALCRVPACVHCPPKVKLLSLAQLLDLAVSLLPGLDGEDVDLLFLAIKSALQDEEGLIQKKGYKILSIILREREEFLSAKLDEILELMIQVLPCHFSAKKHRLDSLYFLIIHVSKNGLERTKSVISSFLTEIILALKEANKKTRNRAYDLLIKIGHACGDAEHGGKKETLLQFFSMVSGGLAGETPHMISAAIKAIARLAYEFTDLVSAVANLLPSAFLLLKRKNKEIIKADLGLIKVLVAKLQAERLQTHLKSMVEGLLQWQDSTKNHFKAKVKFLLEMLVRKCGLDAVKAVMPEEHMKLLTNIKKTKERKERRVAASSEDGTRSLHSKASTTRQSRWNHTKIFSDFGGEADDSDEDTEATNRLSKVPSAIKSKISSLRSVRSYRLDKRLPEDSLDLSENDPLDLLDRQKTRSALHSLDHRKRRQDFDNELPEIAPDGRLVISAEEEKSKPVATTDRDKAGKSEIDSKSLRSSLMGARQKRRKASESGWAYTGSEYASKIAGGDVKRKGKLEPYAYWPLDRKMLNRRKQRKAVAQKGLTDVMKLTKKFEGKSVSSALSVKGSKFKRKQQKMSKRTGDKVR